jgi:glycosyltransferase involved in cell wall biosynthesis
MRSEDDPTDSTHLFEQTCVIIPALNEEQTIASVIDSVRKGMPESHVVVINDGSTDSTERKAREHGATVISLPINIGIGGAVQTGYRYALTHGYRFAMQIDGDGQHDPSEGRQILFPLVENDMDLVVGSRWLGRGDYVAPKGRRFGMRILASLVDWRTGGSFTDTTSGFRVVNLRAMSFFASNYPTDFPEVESLVLASRHGLKIQEVPVKMAEREFGRSSIAGIRSAYYMIRVGMALIVGSLSKEDS